MFGFRRLKRRYRRFRYNNQARYPRLFVIIDMLKLPMQIVLVAAPLWLGVAVYNDYFSFEARSHSPELHAVDAPSATPAQGTGTVVAIERMTPAELQSDSELSGQTDRDKESINQPLKEAMILLGDDSVVPAMFTVENAETEISQSDRTEPVAGTSNKNAPALLPANDNVKVVRVPFTPIEELPDDGSRVEIARALPESDKQTRLAVVMEQLSGPLDIHLDALEDEKSVSLDVRGAEWLVAQADDSYVIQLESSANHEIMEQKALELSVVNNLTIYPFVVSREGEVIYGLSYGHYGSLGEAQRALSELPKELVRYGTWIRQVGALKRRMEGIARQP